MVKIGVLLTKLWPCKVNHHFVKHFSPLCTGFRTYVKAAYLHINSRRFFVHKEKRTTLDHNFVYIDHIKTSQKQYLLILFNHGKFVQIGPV